MKPTRWTPFQPKRSLLNAGGSVVVNVVMVLLLNGGSAAPMSGRSHDDRCGERRLCDSHGVITSNRLMVQLAESAGTTSHTPAEWPGDPDEPYLAPPESSAWEYQPYELDYRECSNQRYLFDRMQARWQARAAKSGQTGAWAVLRILVPEDGHPSRIDVFGSSSTYIARLSTHVASRLRCHRDGGAVERIVHVRLGNSRESVPPVWAGLTWHGRPAFMAKRYEKRLPPHREALDEALDPHALEPTYPL